MKRYSLFILFFIIAFTSTISKAQNVSLNILTGGSGQVSLGGTVFLQVTICNTDPTNYVPANKLRPQISVPASIVSIPASGHSLPAGWSIQFNSGSVIRLCNGTDLIPPNDCRNILIAIHGDVVGGPLTVSGNLLFANGVAGCNVSGSATPGDNPADNSSTSTIQVISAPTCTLAIGSASAGTIACNGGTTTLTATVTGANGTVEYSLNGGAYQPGNTFTVNAAGSPYSVTAREVSSPTCTATSASVAVTEPPIITASSAAGTIVCNGGTTTLTITAAGGTGALQYSLNGGTYQPGNTFTVNAAGSPYIVTVKDANNCTVNTASVTVSQPPVVTAPVVGTITQPTCTIATGSVDLSGLPSGNWTINPGNISGNTTSTTINGLVSSTYNFTVTNSSGCVSAASGNVVINTQPATPSAPTVNIVQPTCTVATGTLTITSSTSSLTFSLDGGAYATYPAGGYIVTSGAHALTAQNASNCISSVTNATVNAQPSTPSAPTINITHPTCTIATGTITITSSTTGLTFSLDGGAYAAYPAGGYNVSPGNHTLSAQNASTCISSVTNANVNAQPPTPSAPTVGTITQPTCAVPTGSVTLNGLPAGNWTINPGNISGNTSSTVISSLNPGTYNFTITNSAGCTSVVSADVIINNPAGAPAAPTFNVVQPTCNVTTGTITITSSTSGLTFSLDGGAYAAYPAGGYTVSAGSHTITAQTSGGCMSPIVNITVNAQPSTPSAPTINVVHPTCSIAAGTITITSSTSGLTFSLDAAAYATYPAGGYIVAAGAHTLTSQNASSCISTVTNINVNVQPPTPTTPTVGAITQPTCAVSTGSVDLSGLPAGNWVINPGAVAGNTTTTTIIGLVPATYNFTVTNSVGCTSVASANVVINNATGTPAAPTVSVVQPTCTVATGTITISSSTTGLTFSLDGAAYAAYPAGGYTVASGPHTLTAQSAGGCISAITNVSINIQPPTPSTPTVTTVQPTCTVATGTITITSSTTGLTFSLDGGAYLAYPVGGYTVAAGAHTLRTQNASNCISAVTNITVNAQPFTPSSPTVNIIQPTCTVATGMITVTSSTTGLTFSLDGAAYAAYPGGGYIVTTGTHTFSAQNASGCVSSVTSVVIDPQPATPPVPFIGTLVQPTCLIPTGSVVVSGLPLGTWTLTRNPGAITTTGNTSSTTVTGLVAGTYSFTVTNAAGCTSASTVNILINNTPLTPAAPTVNITAPVCATGIGIISISSSTTGLVFSLDGAAFATYPAGGYIVSAGSHTIIAQNAGGCNSAATLLTVTAPPLLVAGSAAGAIACSGGTATITVTASGGTAPYTGTGSFTKTAGTWSFIVTDSKGCVSTTTITVTQPAILAASAFGAAVTRCGDLTSITVNATGGTAPYVGTGNFPRAAGTWNFNITDAAGCTAATQVTIAAPECLRVYPNPARSTLSAYHSLATKGTVIQIFDAIGKEMIRKEVLPGTTVTNIDVRTLGSGYYNIVFYKGGFSKYEQWFIKLP